MRDQIGANAFYTRMNLPDYHLDDAGVMVGLYNRVELSYAQLVVASGLAAGGLHAQNAMPGARPMPTSAADPAPRDPSLKPVFDEFGGKPGLTALMDDFMANLMADPRTQPFFANVDRAHVKAGLVDQFCVILGGPCTYTGKNMKQMHEGLDIQRSQFNALVEDLQKAMDRHGIPFRAQNQLLAKLAPMHREVVTQQLRPRSLHQYGANPIMVQ